MVVEESHSRGKQGGAPPPWELSANRRREVLSCLPFLFTERGLGWAAHSELANMTVVVEPGLEKNSLVVKVFDDATGDEIRLWTTTLRMTGLWKRRLRQTSGEAVVLAQARPLCPKCGAALRLRQRNDDAGQFFGCSSFPACRGSLNIVECDTEIPQ